jgi:hypothetical protein
MCTPNYSTYSPHQRLHLPQHTRLSSIPTPFTNKYSQIDKNTPNQEPTHDGDKTCNIDSKEPLRKSDKNKIKNQEKDNNVHPHHRPLAPLLPPTLHQYRVLL